MRSDCRFVEARQQLGARAVKAGTATMRWTDLPALGQIRVRAELPEASASLFAVFAPREMLTR
jgi:hypothetical protein